MTVTLYNPEQWLETAIRGLKDYATNGFHRSIQDGDLNYSGNEVYEIIMEYPSTDKILKTVPLQKVLIHFEIDDIDDRILGFGEGHHRLNYNALLRSIRPQEAGIHRISLDVGVWASDRSGGITARLRAYQVLRNLFHGSLAVQKLRDATTRYIDGQSEGGLEIVEFSGGRFILETINDLPVYRLIDCNLTIRVFSRTELYDQIPTIEEVTVIPDLIIDDNLQLPIGVVITDQGTATEAATSNIENRTVTEAGSGTDQGMQT